MVGSKDRLADGGGEGRLAGGGGEGEVGRWWEQTEDGRWWGGWRAGVEASSPVLCGAPDHRLTLAGHKTACASSNCQLS